MSSRRTFLTGAATSVAAVTAAACTTTEASATAAPVSFSVLYPNHEGARFDLAYYRATHIPMVMRVMNALDVTLTEGVPRGETPPPFVMVAHFRFASAEALDAALAHPEMPAVRADVANFTDIRPTILFGRPA